VNKDVLILFNHLDNLISKLILKNSKDKILTIFRHNRGHVTRGQFCQSLAISGLSYTQKELESVGVTFMDNDGFAYRRFLEWIQPRRVGPLRYNILQKLQNLHKLRILPEIKPLTSIQNVLQKIKWQVKEIYFVHCSNI
jgi:hypothetical protein